MPSTSRLSREEALPFLFGKNTWRVTSVTPKLPCRSKRKGETDFQYHQTLIESKSLFSRYGPLFRNLTVCYDFREGDNRADCLSELHDSWYPSNTRARMDLIHDLSMRHLSDAWDSKCRELNGMVNLTCLVIDVENLYCGIGCCRPVGSLFLAHLHLTEIEEAYIRVKGAKEDDEEKMVEDWRNKRAALRVETQGGDRQ